MTKTTTIKLLLTLITLLPLSGGPLLAQDKQFKSQWEHLIESMCVSRGAYADKTIKGNATFMVFGFRDKQPIPADFIVKGDVVAAQGEKKKVWEVTIDQATADITDSNLDKVKFSGSLKMAVVNNKETKKVEVSILFGPGELSCNGRYLSLPPTSAWEQDQSIRLSFDKEYKMKPMFSISHNNLNLPDRKAINEISPEVSRDLQAALKKYHVDDAGFISSFLEPGTPVTTSTFPDYKEYRTIYHPAPGSTRVSHYDIDSIHFGRIVTPEYEISHFNDITIINGPRIVANFEHGKLKYASWGQQPSYASFSGDTITRLDISRLTGIKWDKDRYTAATGASTAMVKAMQQFTDSAAYEFNEIYNECGLSASRYIDTFGRSEDLVDNVIPSIKEEIDRRALEKTFIGPDRRLDNLRGHVKSMTLRSSSDGASDQHYEYTYDGFYDNAAFGFIKHGLPWSQATAIGDNYFENYPIECPDLNDGGRIKNIYFDITILRNDDGTLSSIDIPFPSNEINRGAFSECFGTKTYIWKDGRPTNLRCSFHEESSEQRYSYDSDGNPVNVKAVEGAEGYETDGTTRYTYTRFDDNGNWLERKVSYRGSSMFDGDEDTIEVEEDSWTEWRDIIYYPRDGENDRGNTTVTITTTISRPGEEPVITIQSSDR